MRSVTILSMLLASTCAVAGCAASSTDALAGSESEVVERGSPDITVLKAEANDTIGGNGSPGFGAGECSPAGDGALDCTRALETRLGRPALHEVRIPRNEFSCRILRVVTATRKAALPTSVGIGFSYAGYGGQGRFIDRAALVPTGEAVLKNGDTVVLHEFVGLANCWQGSATSSQRATYKFKPYLEFRGEDVHRNWDQSNDYSLSLGNSRFDRTGELLR